MILDDIETVISKDLSIALTTSNMAEKFNCVQVALDKYINYEAIEKYKKDIEEDKIMFNSLMQIALNDFVAAKKNHDGIEEYYVLNMDFEPIEEVKKGIIERF